MRTEQFTSPVVTGQANGTDGFSAFLMLCLRVCVFVLAFNVTKVFATPLFNTASPINFFTNVASRLLSAELNLDLMHIQVYPTNQYTPAVHRLLQVTANIYDATTNNAFPSVFRPTFFKYRNGDVYINGYEAIGAVQGGVNASELAAPVDVTGLPNIGVNNNINVYGVPWIIGAKKGLPNFNQFYMRNAVQVTRKLQVWRTDGTKPGADGTNQLYVMSVTNRMGFSFWNSYSNNYVPISGNMTVYFRDIVSMGLTNGAGAYPSFVGGSYPNLAVIQFAFITNYSSSLPWPGSAWNLSYIPAVRTPVPQSFYSGSWNFPFLPESAYQAGAGNFVPMDANPLWDSTSPVPVFPQFGLTTTSRIQAYILDGNHVIDYVQLRGPNSARDINYEIADKLGLDDVTIQNGTAMWDTNGYNNAVAPTRGVVNQIIVSMKGPSGTVLSAWKKPPNMPNISLGSMSLEEAEAVFFKAFFIADGGAYVVNGKIYHNTNLVVQAPYTPTRTVWQLDSWQANDPLVHYLASDLDCLTPYTGRHRSDDLVIAPMPVVLLYSANLHYQPWGRNAQMSMLTGLAGVMVDTNAYNSRYRDPLVWSSDDWNFPTGQDWNLNWLGRVHRGTPWQTIYLKSRDVLNEMVSFGPDVVNIGTNTWRAWTGVSDAREAQLTSPVADWHLVGLLAAMLNTNDLASQFSVNNPDPNAWAGLMDGFAVLTNALDYPYSIYPPQFDSLLVSSNSPQAMAIADAIQTVRAGQVFHDIGDVLAVSQLTEQSPYLNAASAQQLDYGINDEAYEAIPSQLLPLLRADSFGKINFSNGQGQLQFSGYDGHPYAVQVSSDLINWINISTNSPLNGMFNLPVPVIELSPGRFYRSMLLQ